MSSIIVEGGRTLNGTVAVQGSKNAVLPILAACVLSHGTSVIHNCPQLSDVDITIKVLESLGCKSRREADTIIIDSSNPTSDTIPDSLMRQMRSSIVFLGAIIARFKSARVSMPGGCEIGNRPIDLHLKALKKLGVEITEEHGYINCKAKYLHGADIHLEIPSVGATENIMLAASVAEGVTTISNAAREPEIVDLESFLNKMGAKVSGAGSGVITIVGVNSLVGAEHTIIPDRIVAATYLSCAAATGGMITLEKCEPTHLVSVLDVLREMGCKITVDDTTLTLESDGNLTAVPYIKTMPYPGFPTDAQSQFVALSCLCEGTGVFVESIFENRYRYVEELVRMGASIRLDGRVAVTVGKSTLTGARVDAKDLRGGAALILAGLAAGGTTEVMNTKFIDRGYERIEDSLASLGARIYRI